MAGAVAAAGGRHGGGVRPRHERLARACAEALGGEVAGIELPGGARRDAFRVLLADGRRAIATRRSDPAAAAREARVLRALGAAGAPVPEVLAFDGRVLVQSDLGAVRLGQALAAAAGPAEAEGLLAAAIEGLAALHRAGSAAGLDEEVPPLGADGDRSGWLAGLLDRPAVFSDFFGLPRPALPLDELARLYAVPRPRFVKWDARPGNAAVGPGGAVGWFDFEGCRARRRLDDLGWLLCDEYAPDLPGGAEERLLGRFLPLFADGLPAGEARLRLRVFGVFHSLVRLGLVLAERGDGAWWDWGYCLEGDRVGVTREAALRLCRRAARWAGEAPPAAPLGGWLEALAERLPRDRPGQAPRRGRGPGGTAQAGGRRQAP